MRKFWFSIFIVAVIAFSAWPTPSAEALMYRGIYVNGEVHYMNSWPTDKAPIVSHQAGTVDPDTFTLTLGKAVTQNVGSCPVDDGTVVSNAAVFDNKIFFAYAGAPGCELSESFHLYVIAWDLTTNDFVKANGVYAGPTDLGSMNVNLTFNTAIVVYNSLLYVITEYGIFTSADGINWSSYPALAIGGTSTIPLDAITIYPPDADPLIMIIYVGRSDGDPYDATSLYATTWNGQFGDACFLMGQSIVLGLDSGNLGFSRCLGLFAGTATPAFKMQPGNDFNDVGGFMAGTKTPALQLFLGTGSTFRRIEYAYGPEINAGGQWTIDPEVFRPNGSVGYSYYPLYAFPWFIQECTPTNNIMRQHLVINTVFTRLSLRQNLYFTSDAMVPQNTDIPLSCTSTGGTGTDTGAGSPDQNATFQKYWTLAGMIMGSPPFAINESEDFQLATLSNVTYGQDQTAEVSNSQATDNSVLVSAGITVAAGLGRIAGFKDQVDSSYKHAWESVNGTTTSSTLSYGQTFGTTNASTNPDDAANIGTTGWALFHVPTVIIQDYALYAYDYNTDANTGTPLDQDITTTQVNQGDLSFRPAAFELANPGGPNDTYPGLMSGVAPLASSTDLTGWTQGWESNSSTNHYTTMLGDGTAGEPKINSIAFVNGSNGSVSFSKFTQTLATTGTTTDVQVSNQTSLSIGTDLKGFKAGLKVGYDGNFSNSVTTTTTLGSQVGAASVIPVCSDPACLSSLTVQPYLLSATDENAPWVPTGYNTQTPWAMHWKVVGYTTVGGGQSGISTLPDLELVHVVGGHGASADGPKGASRNGSYLVRGGNMVWKTRYGKLKPIPMTAAEFNPALGASVNLNGYTWSSSPKTGTWTRQGRVWLFRTKESVTRDVAVLKLDFGSRTWSFNLSKADLSPFLKASEGRAHQKLSINDKYEFYFDCDHKVRSRWDLEARAATSDGLSLHRYKGLIDTSTGTGKASLEGNLPINLTHFGDMSFSVNGHQINVPLVSRRRLAKALAGGTEFVYRKGGIRLSLDFGKKIWSVHFNNQAFHPLLAPQAGAATIQVKVGGEPWYTGKHKIRNHLSKLNYTNPDPGDSGPSHD